MNKVVKGATILTSDIDEMIHFYCNGIGIPILYKGDGEVLGVKLGYSNDGELIELYLSDTRIEGLEEILIWVSNGESLYEDLSIKGMYINMTENSEERTMYTNDPLGNKVIIKSKN